MNTDEELRKRMDELQGLRDELQVRMHLASMEVKDAWNDLLPRLEQAEKTAEGAVVGTARAALDDLIGSLEKLRARM